MCWCAIKNLHTDWSEAADYLTMRAVSELICMQLHLPWISFIVAETPQLHHCSIFSFSAMSYASFLKSAVVKPKNVCWSWAACYVNALQARHSGLCWISQVYLDLIEKTFFHLVYQLRLSFTYFATSKFCQCSILQAILSTYLRMLHRIDWHAM